MRQAFDHAHEDKWPGCIDMLIFPDYDKLLYVDADALQFGCGAIMFQYDAAGTETLTLRFMAHVFITAAIEWEHL